MSKVAVVYWSGTGNTEAMASYVVKGVQEAGAEATLFTAGEFGVEQMDNFDAVAFGCPSMGAEQLEESEFEPMFIACEPKLKGKKLPCLAHMAGETANGCAPGRKLAAVMEQYSSVKASFVMRRQTQWEKLPVSHSENHWLKRRNQNRRPFNGRLLILIDCGVRRHVP